MKIRVVRCQSALPRIIPQGLSGRSNEVGLVGVFTMLHIILDPPALRFVRVGYCIWIAIMRHVKGKVLILLEG